MRRLRTIVHGLVHGLDTESELVIDTQLLNAIEGREPAPHLACLDVVGARRIDLLLVQPEVVKAIPMLHPGLPLAAPVLGHTAVARRAAFAIETRVRGIL